MRITKVKIATTTKTEPTSDCKLFIKQRHVRNCYRADPACGRGLADALGIALDEALDEKNDPALHPAAAMV